MSDTTIVFELLCDGYTMGKFPSELAAKNNAQMRESSVAESYDIVSVVTTISVLDSFIVPAKVKSVDEIAQEIIDGSEGSYNVEWGEDFAALDFADRERVEAMVWEEIESCDGCGWHFHVDSLEQHVDSGESLCWRCTNDREEEENESEDEDDED